MIDQYQRRLARDIARGHATDMLPDDTTEKTKLFGQIAKLAGNASLSAVSEKMREHTIRTFCGLEYALQQEWLRADTDPDGAVARAFEVRSHADPLHFPPAPYTERMQRAIRTPARFEAITLRTVRYREERGMAPLTASALYASQRLVFMAAMMHHEDFSNLADMVTYTPETLRNGETGHIFTDAAIRYDHRTGLHFAAPLTEYHARVADAQDPRIGCPVTLIKDFIYDLHTHVVDVATENGLIVVSSE